MNARFCALYSLHDDVRAINPSRTGLSHGGAVVIGSPRVLQQFTAAAVMRLVAVRLSTHVGELEPNFPNGDRIAVRQLYVHDVTITKEAPNCRIG